MAQRFVHVSSRYLVPFGGGFRAKTAPTGPPKDAKDGKDVATNQRALGAAIERMRKLQARLMANDRKALRVVFQALDAAGKDGTVRAVMTGINPAGCDVHAFKRPSELELDHDFLRRVASRLPERGRIGIFNRSHYEEVLVVKVHPSILETQRLPTPPRGGALWDERYESIRDFERHLARNGTTIVKFFLNVSKKEQKKRFLERIADPEANWKFQSGDVHERQYFGEYLKAYQRALNETSRPWAPWYAVPADDKPFMRRVVAELLVETLRKMDVHYPAPTEEMRRAMVQTKKTLEAEQ